MASAVYRYVRSSLKSRIAKQKNLYGTQIEPYKFWLRRRDLNPRPYGPEPYALPTALRLNKNKYATIKTKLKNRNLKAAPQYSLRLLLYM